MGHDARRVTTGGRRLVEVLAAAFADDPWLRWTLPYPGAVRSLISLFLRTAALPHGEVWVAGDPVQGVAVLLPPGASPTESPEVGEVVIALHGRRAGLALDADAAIGRHRPADPGWVLHTLGVDPSAQRQGVGGALLHAALRRASGTRLSLETSSARARDWYLRHGFAVDAEVDLATGHGLPADAPTVWLLSRDGVAADRPGQPA
jgi:ribosomal protein S18 acetylase RimI-like enzyme